MQKEALMGGSLLGTGSSGQGILRGELRREGGF